jgi:hypothetical protein
MTKNDFKPGDVVKCVEPISKVSNIYNLKKHYYVVERNRDHRLYLRGVDRAYRISRFEPVKKIADLKVGDWAYTAQSGWKKVEYGETYYEEYPITLGLHCYTTEGKFHINDKFPTAWAYNPYDLSDHPPVELQPTMSEVNQQVMDIVRKYNQNIPECPASLYVKVGSSSNSIVGWMEGVTSKRIKREKIKGGAFIEELADLVGLNPSEVISFEIKIGVDMDPSLTASFAGGRAFSWTYR